LLPAKKNLLKKLKKVLKNKKKQFLKLLIEAVEHLSK